MKLSTSATVLLFDYLQIAPTVFLEQLRASHWLLIFNVNLLGRLDLRCSLLLDRFLFFSCDFIQLFLILGMIDMGDSGLEIA